MTVNTSNGKITASKELLNYISLLAGMAAEDFNNRGRDALYKEAQKFADEIYDSLESEGYYE